MKESTKVELRPSYWASVSGGKDSLYMLWLILQNPDEFPLDGVVHYELEIDYPFIKNVIDYMESECVKHGVRFVRIKPRKSWYELYKKYCMPDKFKRWCNSEYKLDAARQLEQFMRQQGCYVVHYIGYCADEEKRYMHRGDKKKEVYPLVQFGVTEDVIWNWAKDQPIFNNYYKFNKRCGCMYCPMSSRTALAYLLNYYPKEYDNFMRMCKESEEALSKKLGRKRCIFQSNPKYDADYVDRSVREKYLPRLKAMINK